MTPKEVLMSIKSCGENVVWSELEANSILQALREEGYVVVPREPTEKMLIVGSRYGSDVDPCGAIKEAWAEMISATDGE